MHSRPTAELEVLVFVAETSHDQMTKARQKPSLINISSSGSSKLRAQQNS